MNKWYYVGIVALLLFEVANVYFIMPMPGSQEVNSINVAYFLYSWRWLFRALFLLMIIAGFRSAFLRSKWLPAISLVVVVAVACLTNFKMAADTMFYQPSALHMKKISGNTVAQDRLVLGLSVNGEQRAYPIGFLGYHHQVKDTIAGRPIIVTYCTVCRTGRVFEPIVNGRLQQFRLVGMDHFNAMFEDKETHSWWRQATGEAVAGKLKGHKLNELPVMQTTLAKWSALHPATLVMQADQQHLGDYDSSYEGGRLTGKLTRRDTLSWQPKSWVVGVTVAGESKAYDWNRLAQQKIINDELANHRIALAIGKDNKSFVAVERPVGEALLTLRNDTLFARDNAYLFNGKSIDPSKPDLKVVNAYQEYWHSWKTFHPATARF